MGKKKSKILKPFNKYVYYEKSVQNADNEIEFFQEKYKEIRKKNAYSLREDFCGTAWIANKWVTQGKEYTSFGIDLDPEPIAYGKETHYSKLSDDQKKRMQYIEGNVLEQQISKVDISFAFNFSYFCFKDRQTLLAYFKQARNGLKDDGVFFVDIFGGPDSQTVMEEETEHSNFSYFWDCQYFNPLTHDCRFAIHFKRHGEKKRKDVFVYEWRFWTIPEIYDLLKEAGFKDVITYWEGEDEDGEPSGEFYQTRDVENCPAWVTYLAAVK